MVLDDGMKLNVIFKKTLITSALSTLFLTACAGSAPRPVVDDSLANTPQKSEYQRLLAEAQRLSFTLDFDKLRRAFVASPEFSPFGGAKLKGIPEAYQAVESDKFEECLTHIDKVLETNYMSLEAHMIGRVCSNRTESLEREDHHGYMVEGLMEVIENSGDGKNMDSAFETISASELWGFVRLKGWQVLDESIVHSGEGIYDKVQIRDLVSGDEFPLYFEIGHIVKTMSVVENDNF